MEERKFQKLLRSDFLPKEQCYSKYEKNKKEFKEKQLDELLNRHIDKLPDGDNTKEREYDPDGHGIKLLNKNMSNLDANSILIIIDHERTDLFEAKNEDGTEKYSSYEKTLLALALDNEIDISTDRKIENILKKDVLEKSIKEQQLEEELEETVEFEKTVENEEIEEVLE